MQVIYLDMLFAVNTLMDYLLLLASARMAGEPLHRGRMLLAGIFGGLYAGASLLVGGVLDHVAVKLSAAVLMVLIGLGGAARLLRQTMIFFFLSFALGGGVLAIGTLGKSGMAAQGGVIRTGMDLKVVLLSAAICYAFVTLVTRRTARHAGKRGELVRSVLVIGDRQIDFTALVDTGNTLTDPASGRGVLEVDWDRARLLFPQLERDHVLRPAYGLECMNCGATAGRCRLIPYRAVGVECGMLLAVRMDQAYIGNRRIERPLVALSPTAVSDGGAYHALAGDSM